MRQLTVSSFPLSLPNLAAPIGCARSKRLRTFLAFGFLAAATPSATAQDSPDRVDPPFDCSTPILDADTREMARRLRVQFGGDAIVRELRETYADRLAGLFWDQREGEASRLVVRLVGDERETDRHLTVCGEPLTVAFIAGQMHAREDLEKRHADNLEWLRGTFPGLQRTYADERSGEIVLEIYAPEAHGVDVEALRRESESRIGARCAWR
ncbi:hypothetical protein [Neoaquamicrobium sediminum]|uniref:hypothetical protein n=1 Tax=Neoaquamicrobium sediminum TaxID=1849104 RepID=UPI00156460E9|nr:hypothetical protein [Mesorhizobium sediminum]NRC57317.1 hypothetical protein [Mesorhizobium sediminum]